MDGASLALQAHLWRSIALSPLIRLFVQRSLREHYLFSSVLCVTPGARVLR